jgi:hypothetical protein
MGKVNGPEGIELMHYSQFVAALTRQTPNWRNRACRAANIG